VEDEFFSMTVFSVHIEKDIMGLLSLNETIY